MQLRDAIIELFKPHPKADPDGLFKEYIPGSLNSTGHTGSLYNHWKFVRSQKVGAGFIKFNKKRKRKDKNRCMNILNLLIPEKKRSDFVQIYQNFTSLDQNSFEFASRWYKCQKCGLEQTPAS